MCLSVTITVMHSMITLDILDFTTISSAKVSIRLEFCRLSQHNLIYNLLVRLNLISYL